MTAMTAIERLESVAWLWAAATEREIWNGEDDGGQDDAYKEQAIADEIWDEIFAEKHNTSDGHEPDSVILHDDGSWSISYPPLFVGGIRWEQKVRT